MKRFIFTLLLTFSLLRTSFAEKITPQEILEIIENKNTEKLNDFYRKLDNVFGKRHHYKFGLTAFKFSLKK